MRLSLRVVGIFCKESMGNFYAIQCLEIETL